MVFPDAKVNILDLLPGQLAEWLRRLGEPASGAAEIYKCLYRRHEADFEIMTGLSPSLKQKLIDSATLGTLEPVVETVSADGQTRKVLFRLEDGKTIESTLMLFCNVASGRQRRTVCVSSQVGCSMGCPFCATGQQGFERNLSPAEIINQVLYFARRFDEGAAVGEVKPGNELTNIVFMGMGEPLANYDNVRQAIAILGSPKGLGLGPRQLTVSTSGMAPQIIRLAEDNVQCQLAVSLHAANDELRNRLVPIGRKYDLSQLTAACKEYSSRTGRNVYIEYALFEGVNDSSAHAADLAHLLTGLGCAVNLIPGNATPSNGFNSSSSEKAHAFQKILIDKGIRAMLRLSRGADIEAGCGQLRSRWLDGRQSGEGLC